jgi:hypothetical protein
VTRCATLCSVRIPVRRALITTLAGNPFVTWDTVHRGPGHDGRAHDQDEGAYSTRASLPRYDRSDCGRSLQTTNFLWVLTKRIAHREWWGEEDAGAFNDMAVFAHCAVECQRQGRTDCVRETLAAVERLLVGGDEEVRAMASIGFLEDLQNITSHEAFGADVFAAWLGPASREAWDQLIRQWEGKESLADVTRAEAQTDPPSHRERREVGM